jgi:transcriptional regulator with XRE-family HTH domain
MKPTLKFETLGKFVRTHRLEQKLTQPELARAIGYSIYQNISAIERGLAGIPKARIGLMAKALGVSKAKLIDVIQEQERKWF